jgi:hypothetical protein
MALKNCHKCGKEVNSEAKNCPNCGVPVKAKGDIGMGTTLVVIFIAIVLASQADFSPPKQVKDWALLNSMQTSSAR